MKKYLVWLVGGGVIFKLLLIETEIFDFRSMSGLVGLLLIGMMVMFFFIGWGYYLLFEKEYEFSIYEKIIANLCLFLTLVIPFLNFIYDFGLFDLIHESFTDYPMAKRKYFTRSLSTIVFPATQIVALITYSLSLKKNR